VYYLLCIFWLVLTLPGWLVGWFTESKGIPYGQVLESPVAMGLLSQDTGNFSVSDVLVHSPCNGSGDGFSTLGDVAKVLLDALVNNGICGHSGQVIQTVSAFGYNTAGPDY
tara:strand:+ start:274 stop:606 length:333 start_codon:yes stop_codon:yes gene_type:complete